MTEQPQHNALVAFAALTALLAKHPELAEPHVYWAYDARSGIAITIPESADGLALFEQIADALGASSRAGMAVVRESYSMQPHYLEAELAGIPVFGSVHVRSARDGATS